MGLDVESVVGGGSTLSLRDGSEEVGDRSGDGAGGVITQTFEPRVIRGPQVAIRLTDEGAL